MTVPKRAVVTLALACAACAGDASQPEPAADGSGSALCARGAGARVEDLDFGAGTWRVLTAPHGLGADGVPLQVDAVLDTCNELVSVAHDIGPGGKLVRFGPGKLLLSKDGSAWQARDMSTDAYFNDITRGAGAWVAVGRRMATGVIAVSKADDASDWREVFTHDESFDAVAFGGGKFVAVSQRGVAVSGDGEHWSWARLPQAQALYQDVAFGAGRFVVAGVGATLTSADGQRWEVVSCPGGCPVIQTPSGPAPAAIALQDIHFTGGFFYAYGASGHMRSRDGLAFAPFTGARLPSAAVGGRLLSLGQFTVPTEVSVLSESVDDGQTWTPLPVEAIVERADCTVDLCVAARSAVLVFHPAR